MVKALDAPVRGGPPAAPAWRKVKPVHRLDLVVLAAEWGHGRRRGLLLEPAPGGVAPEGLAGGRRRTPCLVMLGKTFKGMTDEMLAWQTADLPPRGDRYDREQGRTSCTSGPELVVEIAFDGRAALGPRTRAAVALRFARVVALPRRTRPPPRPTPSTPCADRRRRRRDLKAAPGVGRVDAVGHARRRIGRATRWAQSGHDEGRSSGGSLPDGRDRLRRGAAHPRPRSVRDRHVRVHRGDPRNVGCGVPRCCDEFGPGRTCVCADALRTRPRAGRACSTPRPAIPAWPRSPDLAVHWHGRRRQPGGARRYTDTGEGQFNVAGTCSNSLALSQKFVMPPLSRRSSSRCRSCYTMSDPQFTLGGVQLDMSVGSRFFEQAPSRNVYRTDTFCLGPPTSWPRVDFRLGTRGAPSTCPTSKHRDASASRPRGRRAGHA